MSAQNGSANYGIIGNVNAKAVALGETANAVVNESSGISRADFDAALSALREQIKAMQLSPQEGEAVSGEIGKLEQMAGAKPEHKAAATDMLKGLVDKLQTFGSLLHAGVALEAPLKILAAWFHVPLPF
jgi:hypothetical protein